MRWPPVTFTAGTLYFSAASAMARNSRGLSGFRALSDGLYKPRLWKFSPVLPCAPSHFCLPFRR